MIAVPLVAFTNTAVRAIRSGPPAVEHGPPAAEEPAELPAVDPPANRGAALKARFALAAIDFPGVLVVAQFAIRLCIVAQGGAAGGDCLPQRVLDCRHQTRGAGAGHGIG